MNIGKLHIGTETYLGKPYIGIEPATSYIIL